MIQLFPTPDGATTITDVEEAVAAEDRTPTGRLPWLLTNMIASADGGTAVDGLSGGLGGPGDKAVFQALRAVSDVILVGASTAREEAYRPPRQPAATQERRRAAGQAANPRLALVTRSLDLDPDLALFTDPEHRPLVITVAEAPSDRRSTLETVAEVVEAGRRDVDLGRALELLAERGVRTVLSEGGPSLNGQLIADGLVDEWNLSLSPHLVAGDSRRAAVGPLPHRPPPSMRLTRAWTDDDFLFCRWVGGRPSET